MKVKFMRCHKLQHKTTRRSFAPQNPNAKDEADLERLFPWILIFLLLNKNEYSMSFGAAEF